MSKENPIYANLIYGSVLEAKKKLVELGQRTRIKNGLSHDDVDKLYQLGAYSQPRRGNPPGSAEFEADPMKLTGWGFEAIKMLANGGVEKMITGDVTAYFEKNAGELERVSAEFGFASIGPAGGGPPGMTMETQVLIGMLCCITTDVAGPVGPSEPV